MEPTLEQLKAKAYDNLAAIEYLQKQLREINEMIVNYKAAPKAETKSNDNSEEVKTK